MLWTDLLMNQGEIVCRHGATKPERTQGDGFKSRTRTDGPLSIRGVIGGDCRLYDDVDEQVLLGWCPHSCLHRRHQLFCRPDVEVVLLGQQRRFEVNQSAKSSRALFISSVMLVHFKEGGGQRVPGGLILWPPMEGRCKILALLRIPCGDDILLRRKVMEEGAA